MFMNETAASSPADHFAISFERMREAMAADAARKGPTGALVRAILRLLERILALLVEMCSGTLDAAAPSHAARGAGATHVCAPGTGYGKCVPIHLGNVGARVICIAIFSTVVISIPSILHIDTVDIAKIILEHARPPFDLHRVHVTLDDGDQRSAWFERLEDAKGFADDLRRDANSDRKGRGRPAVTFVLCDHDNGYRESDDGGFSDRE